MRVLISGVSGFVGRRLARHLVESGDEVAGMATERDFAIAGVKLQVADLLEPSSLAAAVERFDPEVVVHLAGLSHVGESWRRVAAYFDVNVLGTENLLAASRGRRFVLASSAEIYGPVPEAEQPIPEERPVAPPSPYAVTKAAAERLALRAGRAIIVRSFNLVGPGQSHRFALPAFAVQLAAIRDGRQEPVLAVGNLEARRDFLHVDDGVAGYRVLAERGEEGQVYNLGSGEDWSMRQALDLLMDVAGVAARVEIDPLRFRPVDLPLLRADTRRLRALGWAPRRGLREALQDLWEEVAAGGGAE